MHRPASWMLALSALCCPEAGGAPQAAPTYQYRVVASHPHDAAAFTQGLLIQDGRLFESTGGYGESTLRQVDLPSGRILRQHRLAPHLFGEGLALAGEQLYQLTWKAGLGLIFEAASFKLAGEFRYAGEGWGLAFDGERLVMSDGSARLRFLSLRDQAVLGLVEVREGAAPITGLNELEYVEGLLYANVWPSNRIAMLNPANGQVQGWLDLKDILPVLFRHPNIDVLNGIAYDAPSKRLFVTGKRWPKLFEIEVLGVAADR